MSAVTSITVHDVGPCDRCDLPATTMFVIETDGDTVPPRFEFECDTSHDEKDGDA